MFIGINPQVIAAKGISGAEKYPKQHYPLPWVCVFAKTHSSISRYPRCICSNALFAALCSASFLLLPLPVPKSRPSCVTSATNTLS